MAIEHRDNDSINRTQATHVNSILYGIICIELLSLNIRGNWASLFVNITA